MTSNAICRHRLKNLGDVPRRQAPVFARDLRQIAMIADNVLDFDGRNSVDSVLIRGLPISRHALSVLLHPRQRPILRLAIFNHCRCSQYPSIGDGQRFESADSTQAINSRALAPSFEPGSSRARMHSQPQRRAINYLPQRTPKAKMHLRCDRTPRQRQRDPR
jgi:hypothetical protein